MQLSIFMAVCLLLSSSAVEWKGETSYEMGDLIRNEPATHEFVFRNVSGEPMIIDNVRTSCGCTVPEWDEVPVAPDSTGVIAVTYDARDLGYFKKKVKVYFSNQRKAEVLFIEGWVEEL
ncbi:MAG: DUF1573 domain-containing protein [Phaeodactylibacter sp.]|uniref:DUF1573 domain-containing protein n=1 Tax=Phaeodactylibacter sp. TaxID=1940289 RepID=UPI0032EBDFE5